MAAFKMASTYKYVFISQSTQAFSTPSIAITAILFFKHCRLFRKFNDIRYIYDTQSTVTNLIYRIVYTLQRLEATLRTRCQSQSGM